MREVKMLWRQSPHPAQQLATFAKIIMKRRGSINLNNTQFVAQIHTIYLDYRVQLCQCPLIPKSKYWLRIYTAASPSCEKSVSPLQATLNKKDNKSAV